MEIGNLKGPFQFWHGPMILSYPTSENKTNLPFKGQEILLENWCKWKEKKPLKSEVPESKSHLCYFYVTLVRSFQLT